MIVSKLPNIPVYYCYVLIDPRTNNPFYVGASLINKKGRNRFSEHLKKTKDKLSRTEKLDFKESVICKILNLNLLPRILIISYHFTKEEVSAVEQRLIGLWGRRIANPNGILTNITKGGFGGSIGSKKGRKFKPSTLEAMSKAQQRRRALQHGFNSIEEWNNYTARQKLTKYEEDVVKFLERQQYTTPKKTWEEIHGEEKAIELKRHRRKLNLERGVMPPSQLGKSSPNKGKSLIELHGSEKAAEIKQKQNAARKKRGQNVKS